MRIPLDKDGPLVLWDPSSDEPALRAGLHLEVDFCADVACRWAHVAVVNLEQVDGSEGEAPTPSGPRREISIHIDSGELEAASPPGQGGDAAAPLERLESIVEAKGDWLLPVLQKRWRRAHGVGRDDWQKYDWSAWRPGFTVAWHEAFPNDANLLFESGSRSLWAEDCYCITAGCGCRAAVLNIVLVQPDGLQPDTRITVDLDRGTIEDTDSDGPASPAQEALWSDLLRDEPRALDEMRRRHEDLQRIAPSIRALASGDRPHPKTRATRVGRNDPCPCGSGKKFKKCCLGETGPDA